MWGQPVVLMWAAGVAGIAVAATVWTRLAWRHVEIEAELEPARGFSGDDIALLVRIVNDKRLPLPIVRVVASFPEGLWPERRPDPTGLRGHRRRLSIDGRSEVTLRLPIFARSRGEYFFEDVEITLADPFELAPVSRTVSLDRPLLVLPEPSTAVPLRIPRRLPFGAPAPAMHLYEDREHFAGVRDYERGDPMHHVHWRASAHVGRLQTKKYEPTRSAEVLFALDVSHGEPFWYGVDPDTAETSIAWTSYFARQAIHAGWRAALVANTHLRKGRGPLRVPAGETRGQEAALFTALARMPNQPTSDLGPVLREVGRRLGRRTTVVVVSAKPGPALRNEMEVLRRRGSEVLHVSPIEAAAAAMGDDRP